MKLAVLRLDGRIVLRRDARSPLTADIFNNLSGAYELPDRADYVQYMSAELRTPIRDGAALEMLIDGQRIAASTVNAPHPIVLTDAVCRRARGAHQA